MVRVVDPGGICFRGGEVSIKMRGVVRYETKQLGYKTEAECGSANILLLRLVLAEHAPWCEMEVDFKPH